MLPEPPYGPLLGEYLGPPLRDGDGVLEMCGEPAVGRHRGPAVRQRPDVRPAGVDHRLHREDQARLEPGACPGLPEVRDLRGFVEPPADAVPHELAYHR